MGAEATDAELIVASRRRPELFEVVFERHHPAVVRFAAGRVGFDEASDVAAEVFVRAFERRSRYRAVRASALPWLFGITVNVVRERGRKAGRRRRAYAQHAGMPLDDQTFDGEVVDRVDAGSRAGELLEALSHLPDQEYEVLMLTAHADLTYAEMAESLGIPVGTVRSRLSRARARIRELMESERPLQSGPRLTHERAP